MWSLGLRGLGVCGFGLTGLYPVSNVERRFEPSGTRSTGLELPDLFCGADEQKLPH